jgi:septal ring-binding cell division protein DamX
MSEEGDGAGKGLVSSALLVAAVALILIAGMFLRSSGPHAALHQASSAASPVPSIPLGSTITPELPAEAPAETAPTTSPEPGAVEAAPAKAPQPAPPADPLVVSLAARARDDCGRIAKGRGRWTAQLIVACKPQTVERLLDAARGSTGVYVLPADLNNDACFRVCFGTYATSKEAAAAADLPKALRGKERIGAVEIAKVLP